MMNKSNTNQTTTALSTTVNVLHETQKRQFCGLHAINNLLQLTNEDKLNVEQMDKIADEMYNREQQLFREAMCSEEDDGVDSSWLCFMNRRQQAPPPIKIKNNHKSKRFLLGSFGNYSFEVIYEALKFKGFEMSRVDITKSDWEIDSEDVVGLVINAVNYKTVKKSYLEKSHIEKGYCSCFAFLDRRKATKGEKQKICPPATDNNNNQQSTTATATTTKTDEFVQAAVGGHWFAIGKVFVNARAFHEQTDVTSSSSSTSDRNSESSEPHNDDYQAIANESVESSCAEVEASTATSHSPNYYWFNHDSTLKHALFLKSAFDVYAYVRQLAQQKQIVCYKVVRIRKS
jgi:hypothetical protein